MADRDRNFQQEWAKRVANDPSLRRLSRSAYIKKKREARRRYNREQNAAAPASRRQKWDAYPR